MYDQSLVLDAPWQDFLAEVDQALSGPAQLVCIGGFVVTNVHGFSRATADIDYIESPRELAQELEAIAGRGSRLQKKYGLYLDNVAGVVTMPINFEDRLTELPFGFAHLRIFVPDVYDLVLSKLERNSPKDYADVQFLAEKYGLSFAGLVQRFESELDFLPNRERHGNTLSFWREWFVG